MDQQSENFIFCPSCEHKQSSVNLECEACGLIFSKYLKYTPIKAFLNKFMSPKEIMQIRKAEERFTKVQNDRQSKTELIIRCQKERLLDLASYHTRRENDNDSMDLIKKLSSSLYIDNEKGKSVWTPSLIMSSIILVILAALTLILRSYI